MDSRSLGCPAIVSSTYKACGGTPCDWAPYCQDHKCCVHDCSLMRHEDYIKWSPACWRHKCYTNGCYRIGLGVMLPCSYHTK
jgi:hypothetical protein